MLEILNVIHSLRISKFVVFFKGTEPLSIRDGMPLIFAPELAISGEIRLNE